MPIAVRTESGFCRRNKESRNFKVITMSRYGSSPPKLGGVAAHQEISRSLLCWRGRGGSPAFWNHPVCAVSERDLFLNGAATPPNLGGELCNAARLSRILTSSPVRQPSPSRDRSESAPGPDRGRPSRNCSKSAARSEGTRSDRPEA